MSTKWRSYRLTVTNPQSELVTDIEVRVVPADAWDDAEIEDVLRDPTFYGIVLAEGWLNWAEELSEVAEDIAQDIALDCKNQDEREERRGRGD